MKYIFLNLWFILYIELFQGEYYKSFLCNNSIEFSNFSSAKSVYDMLNEENYGLILNLFENNIIDIEKEDTQNVYEIRYNENKNNSNKKFVKKNI